jgi:hypothetical protein
MITCECKSGFFSLRDCDGVVASHCNTCQRGVCSRHISPASGFTQCLDCWARGAQEKDQSQQPVSDSDTGALAPMNRPPDAVGDDVSVTDEWTYGYRHRFYSSGYSPIYAGTHYSTYYDTYDTRSFDEYDAGDTETDDSGGSFGDS